LGNVSAGKSPSEGIGRSSPGGGWGPTARWLILLLIGGGGFAADLATKNWVFERQGFPGTRGPLWLIRDVLSFETSLNAGALFGFGQGYTWVFLSLAVVALAGIGIWLIRYSMPSDRLLTVALGCVTAGILGNGYDRLALHGLRFVQGEGTTTPAYAVRDWIHFQYGSFDWPIFNLADVMLVCGAALLLWNSTRAPLQNASTEPETG
jgi:signal peptidase II